MRIKLCLLTMTPFKVKKKKHCLDLTQGHKYEAPSEDHSLFGFN